MGWRSLEMIILLGWVNDTITRLSERMKNNSTVGLLAIHIEKFLPYMYTSTSFPHVGAAYENKVQSNLAQFKQCCPLPSIVII